ncbi:oligoendopeptidase F [Helcococcus ovis]|uniref:oligoendopeptidase F n=1 Tax=Helcococcus ovis TaxID=72026 RepID=UPI0038BCC242
MKREDAKIEQTWDISLIYKSVGEYEQQLERYKDLILKFIENYKGKINSLEILKSSIRDMIEFSEIASKISHYATLPVEANTFDEEAENRANDLNQIFAEYGAMLSFYESEILELDTKILEEAKKEKDFKVFIEDILEQKAHTLSPDVEKALKSLSPILNSPYRLYGETKFKDIAFPDFEANGEKHSLSYNKFEGSLEYSKNTEIRRNAFEAFSNTLRKYENTTASVYNTQVQKEKIISKLRGYDSVFDYLLSSQKVSKELYNRQMDIIMEELAPHMRKYASILKRVHKLDTIKYSDLKMEVDPDYSKKVSYEEAEKYVLEGLSILGDDYLAIMKEAFENRWIDYVDSEGKSTGAFCASPYGTNSYILMSFNENMSDVMTLAHELGHAGHFQLTHKHQSILNSEPSMYFVESPSTTNELIVENHLLNVAEKDNDLRMKRWVLSQMVAKTYYHNFVTHLLEAYYQREVYKLVDEGRQVNAKILNKIFRETLEKFWGDVVELVEGSELTWMRQPHYYMGLYPYTYSAGLTIGTQVSKKIRAEGKEVANKWKEVLKLGGSKSPQELAQLAGVDVSTDAPLKDTVAYIGSLISEIEEISVKLGEI